MAIDIIKNQPIDFKTQEELDIDCSCKGQTYEQIINITDETQFQVKTFTIIANGDFSNGLDGWDIIDSLSGVVDFTNVTFGGDCDGTITVTASGGTPPYEYSIDGIIFQISNIFTNLCAGTYNVYIKDSLLNIWSKSIGIGQNVDCSLYAGADAYDVLAIEALSIKDCPASCLAGLGGC